MKTLLKKYAAFFLVAVLLFASCKKEKGALLPPIVSPPGTNNKPPVANAGFNQTIMLPKDSVTLNGSASADPDGTIISYRWIKISGPAPSTIMKPDSSVTLVKTLVTGVYSFVLTVTDNRGISAKDTVQIIMDDPAVNQPPIANAGADQIIILPINTTTIDGGGSIDPEGSVLVYSWIQLTGPNQSVISNPSHYASTVRNLIEGIYLFELEVTDNGSNSAKDTVQIIMDNPAVNQPPIAKAGADQIITLPINTTTIDGSGSIDPEGSVLVYSWSQLSGPNQSVIINPSHFASTVKNMIGGIYLFKLKVTDNGGLFSYDSVAITVIPSVIIPACTIQLIPVGALSISRNNPGAATGGSKIMFAGGFSGSGPTSRIDIYDMVTQQWATSELSEARTGIGAITVGNKMLFAGGAKNFDYSQGWFDLSTRVDIYDISTNSWSTTELPVPINFLWWEGAVAAVGNKAFFCGNSNDSVYIFDVISNSWAAAKLSGHRFDLAATSVGNKILIAGWGSNKVDVYDASTNTWSIDLLNQARSAITAATLNSKAFFAGGQYTNKVDIYDDATHSWSLDTLSRPNGGLSTVLCGGAAPLGQRVLFFGGNLVDVYYYSTNTWSICSVAEYFCDNSAIIAAGGNVYITKGNVIWRVQL